MQAGKPAWALRPEGGCSPVCRKICGSLLRSSSAGFFSSKAPKTGSFFVRFSQRWAFVQTLQNTFYRTSLFLESLETIKNSPFRMKYAASFAPQPENLPRYVICADVPKTQPPPAPRAASVPNKNTAKCLYLKNTRLSRKIRRSDRLLRIFCVYFCTDYRWE